MPEKKSENVECLSMDGIATMDERRHNALNCVCCHDDGVAELQDKNKAEEVSVLLARLLVDSDSGIMGNPASRNTATAASLEISFAAVGVFYAIA